MEKDLDKVLNYMKQYVENVYEHDSEPMLNWKDLQLILKEIDRLNNKLNNAIKFIHYYIDQIHLKKDDKLYELLDILGE